MRLVFFAPDAPTVRIASLTSPDLDLFEGVEGGAAAALSGQVSAEGLGRIRSNADAVLDDLLRRADQEAKAGARIIMWGETNSFSLKQDEPAMIARGAEFARDREIYLGMSPAVFGGESDKPLENKIILIDPRGEVSFEYWKAIPVPGPDASLQAVDDGRIQVVDTPHGRLGAAICFDMDFPGHLKQAGRQDADIMLVPSNDWREIDPWHSHMARFRAVEQGFNMVRHVSNGFSLATDYHGRVLASMDHFVTDLRDMVAVVPTRGVRTVYSRIGDLFAWLCMAGLVAAVGRSTWPTRS
jgi:apolipoprotein N-acyltransferase